MTPEDFTIHDPAWWAQEDAAFDAQLDHYDGVPMAEKVRAKRWYSTYWGG